VHVSEDTRKAIIARVQQVRKEILQMAEADVAPQRGGAGQFSGVSAVAALGAGVAAYETNKHNF